MFEDTYKEIKDGEVLLAIIDSMKGFKDGLNFYGSKNDCIQVGAFRYNEGKVLRAHRHIDRPRTARKTQEILICLQGVCSVNIFNMRDNFVTGTFLTPGWFVILYEGGVKYRILEDDTRLIEIKNGPYDVVNDSDDRVLIEGA